MMAKQQDRSLQIHFRVTPSEFYSIKADAVKAGLSVSEFARRSLTGEQIVSAPPVEFTEMIREIKRVGSNINQLVRKLNALGIAHPLELERNADDIQEVIKTLYLTYRPGKGE